MTEQCAIDVCEFYTEGCNTLCFLHEKADADFNIFMDSAGEPSMEVD